MSISRLRFVCAGMCLMSMFYVQSVAAEIARQAGITVHVDNCQTDLEKTICTLAARLDALRDKVPYWDGPFETDPACDTALLVLAQKLGKASPTLRHETLERIFTWQGRTRDGWATYPGGPYDHNNTAIILLSLQAIGIGRDNPEVKEAWKAFEKRGGIDRLTVTSRMFLDALGLYPNNAAPLLNPKIVALPEISPVNIFKLGILRSVIIPQIGFKYYTHIPKAQPVRKELLKERGNLFGRAFSLSKMDDAQTFTLLDGKSEPDPWYYFTNKLLAAMVPNSDEFWAQEILAWTLKLQQSDGTWYALASTINALLLLKEAQEKGVADFSPEIDAAWNGLMQARRKSYQGTLFVQTILSTVWDTANALFALLNVSPHLISQPKDIWQNTINWLLQHQFHAKDMPIERDHIVPKAWSFSHLDSEYLDSDDTAAVLNALLETYAMYPSVRLEETIASAVEWLLQLQNEDGGFPGWDRGISKSFFQLMGASFKDLVDVADVSQTDVTARILYVLTRLKDKKILPAYQSALEISMANACGFIKRSATVLADQKTHVWFGDWAVNYIYATSLATTSLLHTKCWTPQEAFPSVQWIMKTQNQNGGWGESPESYKRGEYVPAKPTIFQTAVALLALTEYYATDKETSEARQSIRSSIEKGIAYLIKKTDLGRNTQEDTYTAVAVKGQMFVQYYYVPYYFTLYTLTRWHKLQSE